MFRRKFLLIALLILVLPACAAEQAPPALAGHVARIQESVALNGSELKSAGTLVHVGDTLTTGKDARLEVRFVDGSTLLLGENGKLMVEDFAYDAVKLEGNGALNIPEGSFKLTTAALPKLEEHPYKVKTPLSVIDLLSASFWGGQTGDVYSVLLLGGKGVYIEFMEDGDDKRALLTGAGNAAEVEAANKKPRGPVVWSPETQAGAIAAVEFK